MIGPLIVGIVFLLISFFLFYIAITDESWSVGVFGVVLVVAAIMFLFADGYQYGTGKPKSLKHLGQTNLKVLAACTNDNSVFLVGLLPDGSVQTFSYASNDDSSNLVEVGRYHYVFDGKLTLFPREEAELPSSK